MVKMQIHLRPIGTGLSFTSHVQIKSAVSIKQKTKNQAALNTQFSVTERQTKGKLDPVESRW